MIEIYLLEQLEAFARCGTLSGAAEELHLSQPALTRSMKKLEDGKKASIDFKKASANELHEYFTKVLPEWDRDRVKNSHIQKLIQWYNILIEAGITDFEEEMKPTEGDNIDDRKEQE